MYDTLIIIQSIHSSEFFIGQSTAETSFLMSSESSRPAMFLIIDKKTIVTDIKHSFPFCLNKRLQLAFF